MLPSPVDFPAGVDKAARGLRCRQLCYFDQKYLGCHQAALCLLRGIRSGNNHDAKSAIHFVLYAAECPGKWTCILQKEQERPTHSPGGNNNPETGMWQFYNVCSYSLTILRLEFGRAQDVVTALHWEANSYTYTGLRGCIQNVGYPLTEGYVIDQTNQTSWQTRSLAAQEKELAGSDSDLQHPYSGFSTRLQYKKVAPVGDRVFVKIDKEEDKSASGILLPSSAQKKPTQGEVVVAGDAKALKVIRV